MIRRIPFGVGGSLGATKRCCALCRNAKPVSMSPQEAASIGSCSLDEAMRLWWKPFLAVPPTTGYLLKPYNLHSYWSSIVEPDEFSAVWPQLTQGKPQEKGTLSLDVCRSIEDYFVVLLSGFDVLDVTWSAQAVSLSHATPSQGPNKSTVQHSANGVLQLKHARTFVSWAPTDSLIPLPFSMTLGLKRRPALPGDAGEALPNAGVPPPTVTSEFGVTRVEFSADLVSTLLSAGCPQTIANCTQNKDAMTMLMTLRRAGVKPQAITYNALLSASRKQEKWASALGIL